MNEKEAREKAKQTLYEGIYDGRYRGQLEERIAQVLLSTAKQARREALEWVLEEAGDMQIHVGLCMSIEKELRRMAGEGE